MSYSARTRTPRGGGGLAATSGGMALGADMPDKNRLMTDRAAYLNFLEVQLGRPDDRPRGVFELPRGAIG